MPEKQIDPSKASIDLDALCLQSWETTVSILPPDPDDPDGPERASNHYRLKLGGGLGRVTTHDGNYFVDPVGRVTVAGRMHGIPVEAHEALSAMLDRWVAVGLPLRLLEFDDATMVLEDGSNFLVLPPGDIKISAVQGP